VGSRELLLFCFFFDSIDCFHFFFVNIGWWWVVGRQEKQLILNQMGELSAVQALCRPLNPGEFRGTLAKRVQAGLSQDPLSTMVLPEPLSLALQTATLV
jgi:hypothetical protein